MKKLITLSIAAIAASMMVSAAYASDSIVQQRLANENAAYFQQNDNQDSVAGNPDKAKHSKTEGTSDNQHNGHTSVSIPQQHQHTGGTGSR